MKKTILLICALFALHGSVTAQFDCLSQSKRLREKYDHKEYGPIACTCPCDQYKAEGLQSADRNKCLECLHYHYPRPFILMTQASSKPTPLLKRWYKNPRHILNQLIARYYAKKSADASAA